jgi:acetyltransferase-like isoleucine patch superfamily enzyme
VEGKPQIRSVGIVDVTFGTGVIVVQPVNLYGCTIGDETFVGPFVEIQRDVTIGKHCRIQSHSFICELVTIGDDCFVSHGAMFINDRFEQGGPAKGRRDLWRCTRIGDNVSIDVVVGAGAVVTKDITEPGVYAGTPARLLRRRLLPRAVSDEAERTGRQGL